MSEPAAAVQESAPVTPAPAPPAPPAHDPSKAPISNRPRFADAIAKARAAVLVTAAPPAATAPPVTAPDPTRQAEISLPDEIVKKIATLEADNRALKKVKENPPPPAVDPVSELAALYRTDPRKAIAKLAGKPDAEQEILDLLADHYTRAGQDSPGPPKDDLAVEVARLRAESEARKTAEAKANEAAAERDSKSFIGGILDHNAKKYPRIARKDNRDEALGTAFAKAADLAKTRGLTKEALAALPDTEVAALVDEALAATEAHYADLAKRWADLPTEENPGTLVAGKEDRPPNQKSPQTQAPPISKPPVLTAPPPKRLTAKEATEKAKRAAMALIGK